MSQLPGIGKRTALRLVLHLLKQPKEQTVFLSQALTLMREEIKFCSSCHNISDSFVCEICNNQNRDHKTVCVVEDIRDVMDFVIDGTYKQELQTSGFPATSNQRIWHNGKIIHKDFRKNYNANTNNF